LVNSYYLLKQRAYSEIAIVDRYPVVPVIATPKIGEYKLHVHKRGMMENIRRLDGIGNVVVMLD
jgi:hypothetical protein